MLDLIMLDYILICVDSVIMYYFASFHNFNFITIKECVSLYTLDIDLFLRPCLCYQLQSIEQNIYVLL